MRSVLRLAFVASSIALPMRAQERPSDTLLTVARYLDYETVSDPQPSPDGTQVVFTRRSVDKMKDNFETALWIMSADGSRLRFLVKGGAPVWSPDGTRIAYLAEGAPGGSQIFVRYMDAEGSVTQVTHVARSPGGLRWSPDGKQIGFSMLVSKDTPWRIDMPAAPAGAEWTKAPRIVDNLIYRADRTGYLDPAYSHLFVVPAIGGTPRQVTRGDWNAVPRGGRGWDWLPDGKTVVVAGNDSSDAERMYQRQNLYSVDVMTGAKRLLTTRAGQWGNPLVSPDGKLIAFQGFPAEGPSSYHASDLYTIAPDGSGMTLRTPGLDRDPADVAWSADGKGLYFTAEDRGTSNLWFAALGSAARQVTTGTHIIGNAAVTRNGTVFAVRTNYNHPPDLIRFEIKKPAELTQLTDVNADLLAGTRIGEVEEIWYTSSGGAKIQGWVVKPPSFDPSKKYPLIFEIHGGPHGDYNTGFNFSFQNFAANGFVVLYTNPRGSTGYGTAFGNAIMHDYPGVDYDDLMAGVDTVIGRGYVNTSQMYVGGCSGGGVLSSWVIGHTDRFAAAAVRCPVIDWLAFAGETDIPLFTYNFFEKPFWEDPAPWLKHSSLMYVGNVKTPTMLMTGVLDQRTPMPQTEEYYSALKMRGIPAVLLRFENEWHGTGSRPSNWMRTQLYMMSWYRKWGGTSNAVMGTGRN
ncbi:MAG TPA: S9 family peptidase [Gemmatimonadales bacterium]|nr:S9 family peptidase [Gemmatimonadales bacterium]